jgi:hypothetical protein
MRRRHTLAPVAAEDGTQFGVSIDSEFGMLRKLDMRSGRRMSRQIQQVNSSHLELNYCKSRKYFMLASLDQRVRVRLSWSVWGPRFQAAVFMAHCTVL